MSSRDCFLNVARRPPANSARNPATGVTLVIFRRHRRSNILGRDSFRAGSEMTNRAISGWYPIASRALFGTFVLLTSIYCLLAYIPDLYFAFIQAPFQPWLVMFIAWHPYIYCVALGALGVALLRTYSGVTRRIAIELLG